MKIEIKIKNLDDFNHLIEKIKKQAEILENYLSQLENFEFDILTE